MMEYTPVALAAGNQSESAGMSTNDTQRRCPINGERTVRVIERGARNLRQNTKADGHLAGS